MSLDLSDLPNIVSGALAPLDMTALAGPDGPTHPPRILLLYGSLREKSYSQMAAEEGNGDELLCDEHQESFDKFVAEMKKSQDK